MSTDGRVCLLDGVGRPQLLQLADPKPRELIRYAHEGVKDKDGGKDKRHPCFVNFDISGERDPEGRIIYRQRGAGTPTPRWKYLPQDRA